MCSVWLPVVFVSLKKCVSAYFSQEDFFPESFKLNVGLLPLFIVSPYLFTHVMGDIISIDTWIIN